MNNIILTKIEKELALFISKQIFEYNRKINRNNYNNLKLDDKHDIELDILGICGEIALAKYLNVYWEPNITGGFAYDIYPNIQVRTTKHENGRLIVHQKDNDNDRYFLVYANNDIFTIKGWIFGKDAKQKEFWCDPTGKNRFAFFVPSNRLIPSNNGEQYD